MITKLYTDSPNYKIIDDLASALERGNLIIYPTGIGYALGCNALKSQAVEEIYRIKQSNIKKQRLAIMCPSLTEVAKYARIDNQAFNYIKSHLEEPTTYILPPLSSLPKVIRSAKEIGVRIALHPITILLLENLTFPLLTTSLPIYKEDKEYLTHPELIEEAYGTFVYTVLDGGIAKGLKSAIVKIDENGVVRLREVEPI